MCFRSKKYTPYVNLSHPSHLCKPRNIGPNIFSQFDSHPLCKSYHKHKLGMDKYWHNYWQIAQIMTCAIRFPPFMSVPGILWGHSCTFQAILFYTFIVFVSTVVAYYNSTIGLNLIIFLPTHQRTKPIIIIPFHFNCSELDIIFWISFEIFLL